MCVYERGTWISCKWKRTMNMIVHGGMAASSMSRDVKETKRRGRRLGLLLLGSNGNVCLCQGETATFYGEAKRKKIKRRRFGLTFGV